MNHVVYILYSLSDRKLYVGCTSNLTKRLSAHNLGLVVSTKHRRPLQLIHTEEYPEATTAYGREKFLKSLWAGRFKKKLIEKMKKGN
ncbi:MAG: hypothetical protein COV07_04440 [Candidatus Vogelbacteria bacterium CG10_big_fil_rev_8_21_14_0_10_45_14]|uniref:GIY-YIG domain-containing protein n=1 Tax=Candidatus Vogelbacteria bacterium CG10_big_fil_rev_8_21_14_0_10_45_14 TaxID=1975042 RepID=A0A2H0RKK5_9BACT|nr:MAG: hypothetical protein COV07_04440 [Candidatus Vogelbacteria bacterium CG10_big_fil_rev_8_21_14_0_10_45_14]